MTVESLSAGARLHRLLALLAYLARVGEAPISDLAERFGLPRDVLVAELELAACCGLPPYTPDQLLELLVDDERVAASGLDALSRPTRLTAEEGLAVAAAARALLAVPGADAGPLASALSKLEAALGADRLRVELEVPAAQLERLKRAVDDHELVEIDYLGAFRGGERTRKIEPHELRLRDGRSYLDAYCRLADDWRRFALERIAAVRPLGVAFQRRPVPDELAASGAFSGGGRARSARISVPAELAGLVERFSDGPLEHRDGVVVVPLRVADERWLGLLLLRLGPGAEVLEPTDLAGAAALAAERALRRYRADPRP